MIRKSINLIIFVGFHLAFITAEFSPSFYEIERFEEAVNNFSHCYISVAHFGGFELKNGIASPYQLTNLKESQRKRDLVVLYSKPNVGKFFATCVLYVILIVEQDRAFADSYFDIAWNNETPTRSNFYLRGYPVFYGSYFKSTCTLIFTFEKQLFVGDPTTFPVVVDMMGTGQIFVVPLNFYAQKVTHTWDNGRIIMLCGTAVRNQDIISTRRLNLFQATTIGALLC